MKEYTKPELELINFQTEKVTTDDNENFGNVSATDDGGI